MRKLFFAFLLMGLAGCASTPPPSPTLPPTLTGQWVAANFKPAPDENAEPYGGDAIYLLESGQAAVWATEIGVPFRASYTSTDHWLTLKEVQVDPGPFTPTIVRYLYDPQAGTLTQQSARVAGQPEDRSATTFKRRSAMVPRFVRRAWKLP